MQRGNLHRDVAAGNVLRLLQSSERAEFTPYNIFAMLEGQREANGKHHKWTREEASIVAGEDPVRVALLKLAGELQGLVQKLDITTLCNAILTDGDLSAPLGDYFESRQTYNTLSVSHLDGFLRLKFITRVQGTREFMSDQLREAILRPNDDGYFHGPIDDLMAMFWTVLYGVLNSNNSRNFSGGEEEEARRLSWAGADREDVFKGILGASYSDKRLSQIMQATFRVLKKWKRFLEELMSAWLQLVEFAQEERMSLEELSVPFYTYAYRGVIGLLQLVAEDQAHQPTKQIHLIAPDIAPTSGPTV